MQLPDALRALRHPNFRTYYTGQAISMIGTWVQSIANTWLAYHLSGSTAISGLVGFMGNIPMLFLAPFAGVMGDRFDKRRILFWVQCLLIVQSVTLAILVGFHQITVPLLVSLVFMIGLLNAVETPTRQSFFVLLIEDRADLANAIALNSVLMNATRLVGPAMGGLLIATTSETVCYIVNAVLTIAVLVSLVKIRFPAPAADVAERKPTGFLADLLDGWRYAYSFPVIRALLVTIGVISFTISPYVSLMPAIVVQGFGGGSDLVGYFIGAVGFGAFIGALRLAARKTMVGLAKWIAIAAVVAGAATIGFSLSRIIWVSMLCMAALGFGFITAGATINTILQSIVDDDKRSRVVSLYTAAFIGSAPLGHLASGSLAELIGAPHTFLVNGIVCLVAGLIFAWRLPHFRNALRPIYIERGIIPPPAQDPNQ